MAKDCTQPLRIGNIKALNGCAGLSHLCALLSVQSKKGEFNMSNDSLSRMFAL